MNTLYPYLAFLPIITLLVISIIKGVRIGVFTGFVITSILYFLWKKNIASYLASLVSTFINMLPILMIIFGAVFLYQVMEQKGYISGIKNSLSEIHPEKTFRFFFLCFFLTGFFESVAGFGIPGTIVPLLLISMGFSPVLSIAVVLLIDGLFAMTGAIGTPVKAGLEAPLKLDENMIGEVYLYAGIIIFFSGIVITFFIQQLLTKDPEYEEKKGLKYGWILYFFIMIPFLIISTFVRDMTGLLASVIMALLSYIFLFNQKNMALRPWIPYFILVLLLIFPKLLGAFEELLSYKIEFYQIFDTQVQASLQPLKSPLFPFLLASGFALVNTGNISFNMKPVFSKTFAVFLILFPSMGITELMLNSGGIHSSMINMIANVCEKSGNIYPLLSPLIGVLGAFVSGSNTVSNIIFGSVQYQSAMNIGIDPAVILSLQLVGGSIGNAVCLFNIIAAAAVAGIYNYRSILKVNLLPVILSSLLCSIIGIIIINIVN